MAENKETKDVPGFFSKDPEKADKEFFGRIANPDRRGFRKRTGPSMPKRRRSGSMTRSR